MSRTVTDAVRGGVGHTTFGVEVEGSINAISARRDSSQVVVAGRSVFKIFHVEECSFRETLNLRVGRITLRYSCSDVVWHPLKDELLATGATNGHVCTWNLLKHQGNKLEHEFTNHSRGVNRVSFHPLEWYILLSGSQDGTMKFFDLRSNLCEATFGGKQNESVRDIQFSPHDSFYFATTSDTGGIQTWDFRRSDKYLLNNVAHIGPAFALDWHPEDRNAIATCGRDKLIKVWKLDNSDNGMTVENTVYCIASVARVKWRPNKKYYIASCSQVVDQTICVWDVRRPYMPFAVFEEHKDMATGVVWKDPHVFMSGGKDGMLYHHIFKDAKRPAESGSPVGVSMSLHGNICHVLSKSSQTESQQQAASYSNTRKPMSFRRRGPAGMQDVFQPYESSMLVYKNQEKDTFSDLFLACAQRFQLTGRPFPELCEHNAKVSRELGRYQVAQTWNMLKLMYSDNPMAKPAIAQPESLKQTDAERVPELSVTPQPNDNTVESAAGQTDDDSALSDSELDGGHTPAALKARDRSRDGSHTAADFFFGEQVRVDGEGEVDEIYDEELSTLSMDAWTLPNEAFSQRHEIVDTYRPPSPDQSQQYKPNTVTPAIELLDTEPDSLGNQLLVAPAIIPSVAKELPFNQLSAKFTPIVADMLAFYANQGDVQMAVSALIVLGDRIRDKISLDDQEQWFMSYIDLLTRFKLWCIASEVTKLSNHSNVSSINQQSTTVYTKCNHCSGQLDQYSWACQRPNCRKLTNTCSVCHLPVKGLYVWCQGCSHGGHIQHIQEWLQENPMCPTGCGHYCEYT
ncbi:GATOR complex protein WDR24-like [Acanthaster planci]|uniref:GATOR2 complex protein WDR24 n=1 Tax=Acanthaster planci TaxID=133434 RepID=A0A8B7XIK3_ACAPL|nr:GATOR complex protein WDR24-like [Acanthaster planci]